MGHHGDLKLSLMAICILMGHHKYFQHKRYCSIFKCVWIWRFCLYCTTIHEDMRDVNVFVMSSSLCEVVFTCDRWGWGCCRQKEVGGGSVMGACGTLPDLDAVGEGGALGGQVMVDVGEGWASVVAGGGTAVQAGGGAGEEGAARALGPGREAGLRVSEAWEEPLNVGASGLGPGPG